MPASEAFALRSTALARSMCCALLFLGLSAPSLHAGVSREYQLKAAFLYNFTKFVEWPPQRFADGNPPIVIGVLGENPFGKELEKIVSGRKVQGREITIRVMTSVADAKSVDAVFVCAGEGMALRPVLEELHDAGVLTVGESESFAANGGIITFATEGDNIRFAVNLQSGGRASLKISAQLLKLATAVRQ